jgi:hypothetical protein
MPDGHNQFLEAAQPWTATADEGKLPKPKAPPVVRCRFCHHPGKNCRTSSAIDGGPAVPCRPKPIPEGVALPYGRATHPRGSLPSGVAGYSRAVPGVGPGMHPVGERPVAYGA